MTQQSQDLTAGWEDKYVEQANGPAWSAEPQPGVTEFVADLEPQSLVLDVGSGDGRNSVVPLRAGHPVIMVDISATAQELALANTAGLAARPVAVTAPMEHLPLASRLCDAAMCLDALPQSTNCHRSLSEMHRVLKPGGRLYLNVFTPQDCAWGEGEQIGPRSWSYKRTLFSFFEAGEFEALCRGLFEVAQVKHLRWTDPPHVPFRPYEHTHDAYFFHLIRI